MSSVDGDQETKSNDHTIPSLQSIQDYTATQLSSIIQTYQEFNIDAVNKWKIQIVQFIETNDINGDKLLNMTKKDFRQSLVDFCNDTKIRGAGNKTYDTFLSLNNQSTQQTTQLVSEEKDNDDMKTNDDQHEEKYEIPTVDQCSTKQLIFILQNHKQFNDAKINEYKQQISKFIEDNNINGQQLLDMKRKDFGQALVDLYNNKKIRGPANKTHDRFKKFDDQKV